MHWHSTLATICFRLAFSMVHLIRKFSSHFRCIDDNKYLKRFKVVTETEYTLKFVRIINLHLLNNDSLLILTHQLLASNRLNLMKIRLPENLALPD